MLLLLWVCICISPPVQVQGALVLSRRDGLRQDAREVTGHSSIKKRSTNWKNVEVHSVRVACTVTSRFARTVVTSKALNAANASQQVGFEMDLPKTAFITSFSMEIDGHIYAGEVKEKEKAKKQYEKAVSKGQSAGLVKVSGRKMEQFSMSVNVAAESSVTFVLIYLQYSNNICAVSAVDGDPHFIIELPDKEDALCFNINDRPGTIYNLVRDQKSVNGQIIGKKTFTPLAKNNTYFGLFAVTHRKLGLQLDVNTDHISVFHNGKHVRLQWSDTTSVKDYSLNIRLINSCSLTVSLRHTVKFRIIRHTKIWKKYHDQQNYLGFYTLDSHHLSSSVHGLLGQFYHGVEFEVTDLHLEVEGKSNAIMYIKGQAINVTRRWEKDFSRDVETGKNVPCWFVNDDGHGLIDGSASVYTVPHLFTF